MTEEFNGSNSLDVISEPLVLMIKVGKYTRFVESLTTTDMSECLAACYAFYSAFAGEPSISRASYSDELYGSKPPAPDAICFPPIIFRHAVGDTMRLQAGLIGVYRVVRECCGNTAPLRKEYPDTSYRSDRTEAGRPAFCSDFKECLRNHHETLWAFDIDVPLAHDLFWNLGEVEIRVTPRGSHYREQPFDASQFPEASTTSPRSDASLIVSAAKRLVRAINAPRLRRRNLK